MPSKSGSNVMHSYYSYKTYLTELSWCNSTLNRALNNSSIYKVCFSVLILNLAIKLLVFTIVSAVQAHRVKSSQ